MHSDDAAGIVLNLKPVAIVLTATGVAGFLEAMSAALAFEAVTTSAWADEAAVSSPTARGAIHKQDRLNTVVSPYFEVIPS